MADLSTTYMGLSLKNPLIVASSGRTGSLEGVQRCADAGAGAVVLKSLFEEQIAAQAESLERSLCPFR
jgi:dihydroorotate dehydrogenase (fumarate)